MSHGSEAPGTPLIGVLSEKLLARDALQFKIALTVTLAARRWRGLFANASGASAAYGAHVATLYYIGASPKGLTQTELAGMLQISGPSLTRQLDKLEAMKMVSRRRMLGDGRMRLIFMEPAGRSALLELDVMASAMRDRVFEGLSDADLETTRRVLQSLTERLAADPGLIPPLPAPAAPPGSGTDR